MRASVPEAKCCEGCELRDDAGGEDERIRYIYTKERDATYLMIRPPYYVGGSCVRGTSRKVCSRRRKSAFSRSQSTGKSRQIATNGVTRRTSLIPEDASFISEEAPAACQKRTTIVDL